MLSLKLDILLMIFVLSFGYYLLFTRGRDNVHLDTKENCQITTERVDSLWRVSKVKEINYFESDKDIYNWYIRSGQIRLQLSDDFASQGDFSMKITVLEKKPVEFALFYFPQAWKYYEFLEFDIDNSNDVTEECEILIGDYFDNSGWYNDLPKYRRKILLKEGTNKFSLSVEEIGREINLDSPRKTIHFLFNPQRSSSIYIDNLHLAQRSSKGIF